VASAAVAPAAAGGAGARDDSSSAQESTRCAHQGLIRRYDSTAYGHFAVATADAIDPDSADPSSWLLLRGGRGQSLRWPSAARGPAPKASCRPPSAARKRLLCVHHAVPDQDQEDQRRVTDPAGGPADLLASSFALDLTAVSPQLYVLLCV